MQPSMTQNVSLQNIYNRQLVLIEKVIVTLHEDLQYDYHLMLETL